MLSVASAVDIILLDRFHGDDSSMGPEWESSFGFFSENVISCAQETDEVLADGITVPVWEQNSQSHKHGYTGIDTWRGT